MTNQQSCYDIRCVNPVSWHLATWELIIIIGSIAIVAGIWRGLLYYRKGRSTLMCRKVIAVAATLMLASSLIHFLFLTANCMNYMNYFKRDPEVTPEMFSVSAQDAKILGFCIGLATIGIIASILLPSGTKKEDNPQPPASG